DTDMTQEQQEYAETIRNSADALLSLINDILDFSKIEAGKMDLEYIDFNLQTLLDNVADLITFKSVEKGLALSCYLHPSVPEHVIGDSGRVRQVLLNLAGNAIKFTEKGEIVICGEKAYENDTHVVVGFSVQDTGIGISKLSMEKLFKSFSQVDASTTRKFGGTGLGLAISKKLVNLMGGEIHVESEENRGSTFRFMLPFAKQQESEGVKIDRPDFSGLRVLVADGYETSRRIIKLHLEATGCYVKGAGTSTEALEALGEAAQAKRQFDIAIIDKHFPEMCACDLGGLIKKSPAIKDTCLVLLSSSAERGNDTKIKKNGFISCLSKPVKPSALYNAISIAAGRGSLQKDSVDMEGESPDLESKPGMARKRAKILLAEDNIVNQKVAVKMLEKMGYRVECVANGQEAIAAVKSIRFDLVLMDCQMPDMDGYEATRMIRALEAGKNSIPIIAMTANAMKGDRTKCLEVGMDDYISKPVKRQVLEDKLRQWVRDGADTPE
ncbi:MAG: response regulator, partial [Planctomycetota bacterium]